MRGDEKDEWLSDTKVVERPPRNLLDAIRTYTQVFLLDAALPWSSRLYQWVRFIGRYLVAKGWLWPIVR